MNYCGFCVKRSEESNILVIVIASTIINGPIEFAARKGYMLLSLISCVVVRVDRIFESSPFSREVVVFTALDARHDKRKNQKPQR